MMELAKILICIPMIARDSGSLSRGLQRMHDLTLNPIPWRMSFPAVLYFVQNTLGFIALVHLSAPMFSVLSQLKILTTAAFSYVLLGRDLSWRYVIERKRRRYDERNSNGG
jgi:UDP-sugar transporter A1/2/3